MKPPQGPPQPSPGLPSSHISTRKVGHPVTRSRSLDPQRASTIGEILSLGKGGNHFSKKNCARPGQMRTLLGGTDCRPTGMNIFFQKINSFAAVLLPALLRTHLDIDPVAQTSKSAVSRVSKPANCVIPNALPTWKSAIRQVWKPALRAGAPGRLVAVSRCAALLLLVLVSGGLAV